MYFDDKSRYSAPWQQDGDDLSDWTFDISPRKKRELQQKAMKDKISAVRRLVGSYDEELIGQLSTEEGELKSYSKVIYSNDFFNNYYDSNLAYEFRQSKRECICGLRIQELLVLNLGMKCILAYYG